MLGFVNMLLLKRAWLHRFVGMLYKILLEQLDRALVMGAKRVQNLQFFLGGDRRGAFDRDAHMNTCIVYF